MEKINILKGLKCPETGEDFSELLNRKNVIIERIVSSDILNDKLYVQEQDEWILLLEGSAVLELRGKEVSLTKMDSFFIESGIPHRVVKTEKGTVWLAVHIFQEQVNC